MSKPRRVMKTAKLRKMRRTLPLVAPSALSRPMVCVRSSTRMRSPLTMVKPEMQSMMIRNDHHVEVEQIEPRKNLSVEVGDGDGVVFLAG